MPPLDVLRLFEPYSEGRHAVFVEGPLYDLTVDDDGAIRPLLEAARGYARHRHGLHLMTYSQSAGLEWEVGLDDSRDAATLRQALTAHHLLDIPPSEDETAHLVRGIATLSRRPTQGLRWANGRDLKLCFAFEFVEHMVPNTLHNGTQTRTQAVTIELAHILGRSLALRRSGNLVLLHGRPGMVDELVRGSFHRVRLPLPDEKAKEAFLSAASAIYKRAALEDRLSPTTVAHLTARIFSGGVRGNHPAAA